MLTNFSFFPSGQRNDMKKKVSLKALRNVLCVGCNSEMCIVVFNLNLMYLLLVMKVTHIFCVEKTKEKRRLFFARGWAESEVRKSWKICFIPISYMAASSWEQNRKIRFSFLHNSDIVPITCSRFVRGSWCKSSTHNRKNITWTCPVVRTWAMSILQLLLKNRTIVLQFMWEIVLKKTWWEINEVCIRKEGRRCSQMWDGKVIEAPREGTKNVFDRGLQFLLRPLRKDKHDYGCRSIQRPKLNCKVMIYFEIPHTFRVVLFYNSLTMNASLIIQKAKASLSVWKTMA